MTTTMLDKLKAHIDGVPVQSVDVLERDDRPATTPAPHRATIVVDEPPAPKRRAASRAPRIELPAVGATIGVAIVRQGQLYEHQAVVEAHDDDDTLSAIQIGGPGSWTGLRAWSYTATEPNRCGWYAV